MPKLLTRKLETGQRGKSVVASRAWNRSYLPSWRRRRGGEKRIAGEGRINVESSNSRVSEANRERNMVSNGVQPFPRDYLRSANFIPVKKVRINEPWKRIVLQGDSERYDDARCPELKFARCFFNVSARNCSSCRNFTNWNSSRFHTGYEISLFLSFNYLDWISKIENRWIVYPDYFTLG